MTKKELEAKLLKLEREIEELKLRQPIQITLPSSPCGLKHYPETPQIYPINPYTPWYPYQPGTPIWWNQIQCQATVPNKEYQDYVAAHTYNLVNSI